MNLVILGVTGSIGSQTLDIVRNHRSEFNVIAVTCNKNIRKLREIIVEFSPSYVSIGQSENIEPLKSEFPDVVFEQGKQGLIGAATYKSDSEVLVVNALVGSAGLEPTIEAIKMKRNIALANKETLVVGGEIIMPLVKEYGVELIPVDSEHSAIKQLIMDKQDDVSEIIITASGGSFRDLSRNELKSVTVKDALDHPNWDMGQKITIDSATMMNKGFEVIEAHYLFNMPYEKIKTVLHRESMIHSLVEFNDSSILAHIGNPDMRVPINYALFYPTRMPYTGKRLDLVKLGALHFEELSYDRYPLFKLAIEAGKTGGLTPTILNAANEESVYLFLEGKISFLDIEEIVGECLNIFKTDLEVTLHNIITLDLRVREYVKNKV